MQLDRTRVAIRERSQLELLDLALRVVVQNLPAFLFALAVGVLPFAALNEAFFSRAGVRAAGSMPADEEAQGEEFAEGIGYTIVLATVVVLQAPLATTFVTLYFGQYMFSPRPRWSRVWADAAHALPQLLILRGLPIALAAAALAFPPQARGVGVVFFAVPALLLGLAAPYANEIILLERNNWSDVFRRWREFHRNTQGLIFQRTLSTATMVSIVAGSLWGGLVFLRNALADRWEYSSMGDAMGLAVEAPLAFWLACGLAAATRYLSYIDLRIRREGWELELAMRAEAQRMEERLA